MRSLILSLLLASGLSAQCTYTAAYPSAVATDTNLFVARDNITTTLNTSMAAGDAVAVVKSSSGWAINMIATVDSEKMLVTSVATNLLTVTRGFGGTAAASHASGKTVSAFIDCDHHEAVKAEVKAIETALGANLTNIPSAPVTNSAAYNFTAYRCNASNVCTPGGSSGAALIIGNNTLTFTPVPAGVAGTHTIAANLPHVFYVSGGTGTAEACPISGGTATSGGTTGTLILACANTHSGAFTIQSNAGGVPEAIYVAGASGGVGIPAGDLTLHANIPPNGTYPLGVAAITIPSGYNTTLIGQGPISTRLLTGGTAGDWIRFECTAACAPGSGGTGGVTDLSMDDFTGTPHTAGAMIRVRYRADHRIYNLYINNAYDGVVNEGGVRFLHALFTVGTWHNGYSITCKGPSGTQANYPACVSYGTVSAPYISSGAANTHAIHIEAPTAGVSVDSAQTGAVSNSGNASVFIAAVGTNPLNEIVFGGATDLDGHAVGIQVTGNGSTYVSNSIKFVGARVNAATNAIFATSFVEGLSCIGCDLNAVSGTASGVAVQFNGDVRRSQILNSPQMGADGSACFVSSGTETDIDFSGNVCGRQTQPTNALALGGTITNFNLRNNWLSGASGAITNSATITGWNAVNNTGIDDVVTTVSSAATYAFPVNPNVLISGSTNVTAVTHPLAAGAAGTIRATAANIIFTAGATIGSTFTLFQGFSAKWFWDGTKIWFSSPVPMVYTAAGTAQAAPHWVFGTCTLGTNCAVTFTGAAAFTGSGTYQCTATDQTAAAAVKVVNTSASVATFTGTGTDVLSYSCVGN